MAADKTDAKSSSAADSYVGSLISLTSKSEIRYEGILYNINTDESSIGLQNVRSFGTEGRKKDGAQVPPSDKVYEYILFRGTDIKDLQVKASPPVQPPHTDPAIIQSHYPTPVPTSSSASLPDIPSHNGQHGMGFQNGMPLYQPPMYWQGFYTPPPNGLPQLHQHSLIRPPHGLPLQYPNFNAPLPTASSTLPEPPSSLPFSRLPSEMTPQDTSLLPFTLPTPRSTHTSGLPLSNSPAPISQPPLTSAPLPGVSTSITQDKPKPLLITPGQLLQSGSAAVSLPPPPQNADKDVDVVQASSAAGLEQSVPVTSDPQPPILPLPSSARPTQKTNGHSFPTHNGYRGRGRGRGRGAGRSHPVMKFTEDFDFTAMNEKFNKDEVWGYLGKSTNGDGDGDGDDDDDSPKVDEDELRKIEVKPVYNKDDFFDSLSSNAIDRDSQYARPRFSEQRKLDTETFGELSRFRGGRGYGHSRGGRGYGGRGGGYGYGGRGQGRGGVSNRTW